MQYSAVFLVPFSGGFVLMQQGVSSVVGKIKLWCEESIVFLIPQTFRCANSYQMWPTPAMLTNSACRTQGCSVTFWLWERTDLGYVSKCCTKYALIVRILSCFLSVFLSIRASLNVFFMACCYDGLSMFETISCVPKLKVEVLTFS